MKIAYVTISDPADRYAWSGINHTIASLLRQAGAEVLPVGPLRPFQRWPAKARTLAARLRPGGKSRYLWTVNPGLLRAYGRQVERELTRLRPDVVFSPGTQPIAYLSARWPTVFWTDAPFGAMRGYYKWYKGVSSASLRDGMACDDRALHACRAACYSSDWAAGAAVSAHGVAPGKVHVLPFGANLDRETLSDELPDLAVHRLGTPWRFLFVGVEWERKGGDLALAVVRELNERGYPSELIVAGCQPPASLRPLPAYVRLEGFISQHTSEGRRRLADLFESALFYLMPSRAEAYGIVFCEANAHGVPCLSTRTGGIPTIVQDGRNGQLFDPDAPAAEYVDFVLRHTDANAYLALVQRSLEAYRDRLSWKVNLPRLTRILAEAAGAAGSSYETRIPIASSSRAVSAGHLST